MFCPACSHPIDSPSDACTACGATLEMECSSCSRRWPVGSAFCAGCGTRLERIVATAAPVERASFAGQRRVVTVVMSDLSGYAAMCERFDPEEIAEIMGVIKREGTAIIESFGGTANQFKGDEIVSLFGVPTAADDDARRAVSAALALHAMVEELNSTLRPRPPVPLAMHTGICTGRVILQHEDSRDGLYGVTGDAINTAARTLGLAERGELVVAEPTHVAVAPYFDTEFAGSHTVRNKAAPLDVYRVLGERSTVSRFDASVERGLTRLAGRDIELDRLTAALSTAETGHAQVVVVEADAGAGKSRLSFEFAARARQLTPDLAVVKGRCQSFGSAIPYLPFRQVIRETLALDNDAAPDATTLAERVSAFGQDLDVHVPAYLHLLGALPVTELPAAWQTDALPDVLGRSIVDLINRSASHQTTILQLDDWHWADDASHRVLLQLAAQHDASRLVVVVSRRPGPHVLDPSIVDDMIVLHPLSRDDTEAMIAAWFSAGVVQPELAHAVHERTAGNPFFVEEVCAALAASGSAQVAHDTVAIAGDASQLAIPDTVQAVVLGRVDTLEPSVRDALRIASVVGREFDLDLVEEIVGRDELAAALPALVSRGFVEMLTSDRYRFHHVITRDVTYDSLLLRERRSIHDRIAQLLEDAQSDVEPRARRRVEMIAHHHQQAGNNARALVHFEVAGRRAMENRSLAQARFMLESAIGESRLVEQTAEVRAWRGRLALDWAAACIFLPSRAQIELLDDVADEAIADGNLTLALRARYWIAWIRYSIGDQNDAERDTRELLALIGDGGGGFTSVLWSHLGQILHVQGRLEEAEDALTHGLPDAMLEVSHEPMRVTGLQCFSLAQLALVHGGLGQFVEADALMRRAVELVRSTPERSTEASIMVCVAMLALRRGEWQAACDAVAAIDSLPDASVSPYVRISVLCITGHARVQLGDVDEGLTVLQQGVAAMESSEAQLTLAMMRAWLADGLSRAGRTADALDAAHAAINRTGIGDVLGQDVAWYVLLRHLGLQDDELRASVDHLLGAAGDNERIQAHVHLSAAEAYRNNGDAPNADRHARLAVQVFERLGAPALARSAASILQPSQG